MKFIEKKIAEEYCFGNSADWWMEKIKTFPHNDWFAPASKDNGDGYDDYKMMDDLFYLNLCEKKMTPIWVNGSFKGRTIEFKINVEL